jgi:DNA-binding CsgD family transcriptional regulator
LFEEALALSREQGHRQGIAARLHNLGVTRLRQGRLEEAARLQRESLALFREEGRPDGIAVNLHGLGLVALERRDYRGAEALVRQSLRLARRVGYKIYVAYCLEALAAAAAGRADWGRAARLLGAAAALRDELGTIYWPYERAWLEPRSAAARAALGDAAFAAAWAAGRALSWEQAADEALSEAAEAAEAETPAASAPAPGAARGAVGAPLTPREREVAALVAAGWTDREVARELGISERTAENHVRHILAKLGGHSRARIAQWAAAHGLGGGPRQPRRIGRGATTGGPRWEAGHERDRPA